MPGMNSIVFIGHLGQDPEIKETSGGKQYARFSVACTTYLGQGDSRTQWMSVQVWNPKVVHPVNVHLQKGMPVIVIGEVTSFKTQDGKVYYNINAKHVGINLYTKDIESQAGPGESETEADNDEEEVPF
jgi:single-strand DNA-binding protein